MYSAKCTSKYFSHHAMVLLLCLLAAGSSATSLVAYASQVRRLRETPGVLRKFPGRGLRILVVHEGSPAQRAGLETYDLIVRYGDFEINDDASFFAARDNYEHGGKAEIPIVFWRNAKALKTTVPPGRLGIESNEYGPVAYQFLSLMMKLDVERQTPEYMQDREFKDGYAPEKTLIEARHLIDQAESESTLTPTQILVARIYMTLDDASPEDLKRQSEMLTQLISTQPVSYLIMLGQDRLFEQKHYRPAIECFKRYLEENPEDVSIRLNLGIAYKQLRMFAEAEAAADYVLDHSLGLSEHGQSVAYRIKATGLLSRGDFAKSIYFAEKAFDLEQCPCDILLVMLAAAETGDLEKLADAQRKFGQALPEKSEQRTFQLAAVEALALVKSNQRDRAREVVQKWKDKDRAEGRLKAYWKIYPSGSDVWTNWTELARN